MMDQHQVYLSECQLIKNGLPTVPLSSTEINKPTANLMVASQIGTLWQTDFETKNDNNFSFSLPKVCYSCFF